MKIAVIVPTDIVRPVSEHTIIVLVQFFTDCISVKIVSKQGDE